MKKDIEWLVQMIGDERESIRKRFESGKGTHNETTFNEGRDWALAKVLRMIQHLEKSEVLSQEWIFENKEMYLINDTSENAVPDYKLQNLLVPEQELPVKVVVPQFVADEFDYNKNPYWEVDESKDVSHILRCAFGNEGKPSDFLDWVYVMAVRNGCEVEEEQKYYVDLDSAAYVAKWNGDGQVNIYTDAVSGSDEHEFHLTEQEIKNYDERFWPFAEPVE